MLAEEFEISFLGSQASAPAPVQERPWHCWDSTQAKTSNNSKKQNKTKNTH